MPTDQYDTTDNDPNAAGRDLSAADLRGLVERIQVGDSDEGAEALGEIMSRAKASATVDRDTVRAMMLEEAAQMKLRAENAEALDKFASKYPALREDNLLTDAAARVLRNQIVDDLKGAGASDEDLAPVRDDTQRLVAAHGAARMRGIKLKSSQELLDSTGAVLTEKFNIRPARREPREYVRDMRRDRGFDGSGQAGTKAPASSDNDRTRAHIQRLRAARGFAPRQAGDR
jgi:hypothetical protein